jgi:SAM-dependent methyltransferase
MHRFVKYDASFKLVGYTDAFYIAQLGIEFAAGIATNPETDDIVVSFGLADKESWLATFSPDSIRAALRSITEPKFEVSVANSEWIAAQTNQALQDKATVDYAGRILSGSNLPHHEDAVKNWDNIISLWHTVNSTAKSAPVMDVAATVGSAYLPSLAKFGYEELISINLTQTQTEVIDGVIYQYGDCTKTDFTDGYFGFISCLSVIEHGVDVESFMRESARILQTGGHLFVSTDYWQDPVDTGGQIAFGVPVRIFTADDIRDMISTAQSYGLEITSEVNLACGQRVVNWIGMDYTFVNLLFKKV